MSRPMQSVRVPRNQVATRRLRGMLAAFVALTLAASAVFAAASSPAAGNHENSGDPVYIGDVREGIVFAGERVTQPLIAPGGQTVIDAGALVSHAAWTLQHHNLPQGTSPEITCALDATQTSSKFQSVTPSGTGGCTFTALANSGASAEGEASFLVIFTSNIRDRDAPQIEDPPGSGTMVYPFWELRRSFSVTIASGIAITPPTEELTVQAGGTLVIDASRYASHAHVMTGNPPVPATVTCGDATSRAILEVPSRGLVEGVQTDIIPGIRRIDSRLTSVTRADPANNPCVYTVTAERELVLIDSEGTPYRTGVANTGTARFLVPYTSSHSVLVEGVMTPVSTHYEITLTVTSASVTPPESAEADNPYPMIEPLDSANCSTEYGAAGALLRDCIALVQAQNHWAEVEVNRNLGIEHPLRSWGQGQFKAIGRWPGVTADEVVKRLDLNGLGIRGSLPPSLWRLRHLEHLDITGNYFTGQIPPTWSNFAKDRYDDDPNQETTGSLSVFYFCFNYLDGGFPISLLKSFNEGKLLFSPMRLLRSYYGATNKNDGSLTNTDITCQEGALYPPSSPYRLYGRAYAQVGPGGQAVSKIVKGLGLSFIETAGELGAALVPQGDGTERTYRYETFSTTAAPLYVWTPSISKWKQSTEYHCIARATPNDPESDCTRWRQTMLPAGSIFYYVDGYVDCRTLTALNLISRRTTATGGSTDCQGRVYPGVARTRTPEPEPIRDPIVFDSDTGEEEEAEDTPVWNTFTVSSLAGVTVAQIKEQLALDDDQEIYVWNGERQAWDEVTSETATLPEGAVITFETLGGVDEEDLGDLNLGAGTDYITLTPGWTILNSPDTTSRVHATSRNFFLTSALINCASGRYVLAVASYNSRNGRWYLWLPCHPRQETALTQPAGSAFRRLLTVNRGDLTYIYYRSSTDQAIEWDSDILKYQPA